MNRFRLALVLLLGAVPVFASSPDPKTLEIPPAELSRARALVQQLGSDLFRERENAQAELNKMGRLAKPVLIDAATTDPDPEVRARASRLLSKATADDLKARIDTFLADADSKYEHNVPGWSHFRKATGGDKAARDLYVDILKTPANVELLAALDKSGDAAGRAIADRRYSLYSVLNRRFQGGLSAASGPSLTVPDVAALLVAETVIESRHIPRSGPFQFVTGGSFLQQPPASNALTPGTPQADTFRKVVAGWLDTRVEPNEMANLTYLVGNQLRGFKESLPLLRRIVATEGVQGWARGQAVTALVREGGKAEIPLLKGMLKNENQLVPVWLGNVGGAVNNNVQLQVRDLALAHLLTLNNLDLKDYGFEFPQGNGQALNASAFGSYAFLTDDARAAAFKKWEAWEKAQPKTEEKK